MKGLCVDTVVRIIRPGLVLRLVLNAERRSDCSEATVYYVLIEMMSRAQLRRRVDYEIGKILESWSGPKCDWVSIAVM